MARLVRHIVNSDGSILNLASRIEVELVGGPLDGDRIDISPQGSCGPPQQLTYMTVKGGQAGWAVYELEHVGDADWPQEVQRRKFLYAGTWSTNYSTRL